MFCDVVMLTTYINTYQKKTLLTLSIVYLLMTSISYHAILISIMLCGFHSSH
jgi:hypothetical protein